MHQKINSVTPAEIIEWRKNNPAGDLLFVKSERTVRFNTNLKKIKSSKLDTSMICLSIYSEIRNSPLFLDFFDVYFTGPIWCNDKYSDSKNATYTLNFSQYTEEQVKEDNSLTESIINESSRWHEAMKILNVEFMKLFHKHNLNSETYNELVRFNLFRICDDDEFDVNPIVTCKCVIDPGKPTVYNYKSRKPILQPLKELGYLSIVNGRLDLSRAWYSVETGYSIKPAVKNLVVRANLKSLKHNTVEDKFFQQNKDSDESQASVLE